MRNNYVRAFVLASGGVDSTTALYRAHAEFRNVEAVSFNYGQRHVKEIHHASAITTRLVGVGHRVITLPSMLSGEGVMLTDSKVDIPDMPYQAITGISPTYVPFRNGTMLSILAAHAMKYVEDVRRVERLSADSPLLKDLVTLYFGAHAEDAHGWAYPDCTPEFVGAMANAIYIGTYRTVRLATPYVHSSKSDIIREGMRMGVPYELTWSCYAGGELHCGVCPTCRARKDAFRVADYMDPTEYAA